jgi:hypothetical protein
VCGSVHTLKKLDGTSDRNLSPANPHGCLVLGAGFAKLSHVSIGFGKSKRVRQTKAKGKREFSLPAGKNTTTNNKV